MTAAYDDYDYPKYWATRGYEHASEVAALNSFFKVVGRVDKILEVGCGHGRLASIYGPFARKITIADPSRKLLAIAKKGLKKQKLEPTVVESTLQNLPTKLSGEKYDCVVLVRVIHHIRSTEIAFKAVHSLLKPGGYLILEFANKLHGKAIIKKLLKGDLTFMIDIFPDDRRSEGNKKKGTIAFLNHNPDAIEQSLLDDGFKIVAKRSVSNIRSGILKKAIPLSILLAIEKMLQVFAAPINFGPSIFILAKKEANT